MALKVCTKCFLSKEESEFHLLHPAKNDGKLRPDCKECGRKRQRDLRAADPEEYDRNVRKNTLAATARAKNYINEYLKNKSCVDCGEDDREVLEFDHVRGEKFKNISEMVYGAYKLSRIEDEIDKCEVRCANCHRKITRKRERGEV